MKYRSLLLTSILAGLLSLSGCASLLQQGAEKHSKGDLEGARKDYEAYLKAQPRDAKVYNNLAILLLQRGLYRQAVDYFKAALNLDPGYLEARQNLAQAYNRIATQSDDQQLRQEAQSYLAGSPVTAMSTNVIASENSSNTPIPVSTPVPAGLKFAVVIGISDYNEKTQGYRALPYAAQDARKVYDYLTKEGGFAPERVKLLTNQEATADNIRRELKQFLRISANNPDDIVLVYYSGHGDLVDQNEAYLVPYGATRRSLVVDGIPLDEVGQSVQKLKSQKVSLFIDACHSGSIMQGVSGKGVLQEKRNISDNFLSLASKGRLIMTSSSESEESLELEGVGGLFTHYLLKGLRGEADLSQDRSITVNELYEYVRRHVEAASRHLTNKSQTPQKNGDLDGVLVKLN